MVIADRKVRVLELLEPLLGTPDGSPFESAWLSYGGTLAELLEHPPHFEDRVLLESGKYSVRTARDLQDVNLALHHRFAEYSHIRWNSPFNPRAKVMSFMNWEVPDKFERYSQLLIVEEDGRMVGSVRLVSEDSPVGNPASQEDSYGVGTLEELLPGYYRVEPSRLCILDEYKNTPAMSHLMGGMVAMGLEIQEERGRTAFVFEAKQHQGVGLYTKLGARSANILLEHAVGETLELMVWPLEDTNPALLRRWQRLFAQPDPYGLASIAV